MAAVNLGLHTRSSSSPHRSISRDAILSNLLRTRYRKGKHMQQLCSIQQFLRGILSKTV